MDTSDNATKIVIDKFVKENRFLSTFYPCSISFEHFLYKSVENAFQAAKTLDHSRRKFINTLTPGKARQFSEAFSAREDWAKIQLDTMIFLQMQKFENPFIQPLLIATQDAVLVEGNTWHDNFWGQCVCHDCVDIIGENHNGKILMNIRDKLL